MSSSPKTHFLNVSGLVAGFGLGQGTMFLAQTWLVAHGSLAVLGELGLGLAILSLAQWTSDWGGLVILSRAAVSGEDSSYFIGANLVRLCLAGVLAVAVASGALIAGGVPILQGMLVGGATSGIFWACNLSGYLDGKRKSRFAGPVSGFSWLAAGIGIFFLDLETPFLSGLMVGLLYLAGTAATVIAHYAIAKRTHVPIEFGWPSKVQLLHFFHEGGLYCLAGLPAQFYGRSLIFIVNAFLGAELAGVFVYIRNIINAANQGVTFLRRVEFPLLVQAVRNNTITLAHGLRTQLWSVGAAVLFYPGLLFAVLLADRIGLADQIGPENYRDIVGNLLIFGPLVPMWTLSTALGQILISMEKTNIFAGTVLASLFVSFIPIMIFIKNYGLLTIVVSEAFMYSFQTVVYLHFLMRRTPLIFNGRQK